MKRNKAKLIFIYAFLGIVLVASIAVAGYFFYVNMQIDDIINSAQYIDMAIEFDSEAVKISEQKELFSSLFLKSLIVSGSILLFIVFIVVINIIIAKKKNKKANSVSDDTSNGINDVANISDIKEPEVPTVEEIHTENVTEEKSESIPEKSQMNHMFGIQIDGDLVNCEKTETQNEKKVEPVSIETKFKPIYCTKCGKKFENKKNFCDACGAKLI